MVKGLQSRPGQSSSSDAADGNRSPVYEAKALVDESKTWKISVSSAGSSNYPGQSGLVCGYHLYSHGQGVLLSGCHHGLVQPLCPGLETL